MQLLHLRNQIFCKTTSALDFFFSSRRRHTRWPRDWSSDVCSSDLVEEPDGAGHHRSSGPEERRARVIRFSRARIVASDPSAMMVSAITNAIPRWLDRKSTRLNSSHVAISYAVFCL